MSVSDIWHMFAGFGALVLSLVVGMAVWVIKRALSELSYHQELTDARLEPLLERIAKIEGRLNGDGA